jgi:hypothetical protein
VFEGDAISCVADGYLPVEVGPPSSSSVLLVGNGSRPVLSVLAVLELVRFRDGLELWWLSEYRRRDLASVEDGVPRP